MITIDRNPSARALRQFSGAWLVFFSAFGAHQWLARGHERIGITLIAAALVFGILGLMKPGAIRWLFVTWMTLAFPIGWLLSQIMLALMFYLVLTPIALIFRLTGRDVLQRKFDPTRKSY